MRRIIFHFNSNSVFYIIIFWESFLWMWCDFATFTTTTINSKVAFAFGQRRRRRMSQFLRKGGPTVEATKDVDLSVVEKKLDSGTSTPAIVTSELLLYPSSSCKIPKEPEFTVDQIRIMSEVKTHLLELHKSLESSDASYIPWERRWIEDPTTSRRYAIAVKWDLANAKKRATDTLQWRREFKPDLLIPDEVKKEGESGKHIVSGFDNVGRPVIYLRPGRENTDANPQQVRYLVWSLERGLDFCPLGQDKLCLLIDYSKATKKTQPSFSTQLHVLSILQNHYPERLGKAIIVNVPWILSSFFTFISPFLDSATRAKVVMLRSPENVKDSIPLDMLDADFGGHWKYQFDFDTYWNTLLDFCGIAPDGTRTHSSKARPAVNNDKDAKATT